jgi:TonB family protein
MKKNTKQIGIAFLFMLGMLFTLKAQTRAIEVTCERNGNKGYNFSYTKNTEGRYLVFVKISGANNLEQTEFKKVVDGSSGHLFSVNVMVRDQSFGFSTYNTAYLRGIPNPKIDTSFVYALPFRYGSELSVSSLIDLREKYFAETPTRKMKAFEFTSVKCDTACAIRKGLVVSVTDMYEMDSTIGKSFTSRVNSLLIEQPDGTLASYSGFKKGSIFVKEGQTVFPYTPLGLLAHYDVSKKHQLRLSVTFLADDNNDFQNENADTKKNKRFYEYINPYFLTDKGVCHIQGGKKYSVGVSDYVIEHEMTKKELKAIGKKSKTENNLTKLYDKTVIIKDTLYSDAQGNDLKSSNNASQYSLRWTDPTNEHRKIFNAFYMSGKLKEEFFYIDNPQLDKKKPPHWYYKDKDLRHIWYMHGLRRAWYETGQLRREVEFQNGNINGRLVTYWDNGQIKRTNIDDKGNAIPTKCFDKTGKEVPVYPMASTGKFDEGKTSVNDYLKEHVVYPKEALEQSLEGYVELHMNIEPDGSVGNIATIKSDHSLFESEVKRVLKSMPKWSSGFYDGEPVPYTSSVIYIFRLPTIKIDWLSKLSSHDTVYYDNTGKIVKSKQYSDNYEILTPDPVDNKKVIERVYSNNGKIRSEKYFLKENLNHIVEDSIKERISLRMFSQKELNAKNRKIDGRYREWYDNGQLSKDFYVQSGKKDGTLSFYWENGTFRRNDVYQNGELVSGTCYDKVGNVIPHFDVDMPAIYPGGKEAMAKYFSENLQYPKNSVQNNIQGTVVVNFIVDINGRITRSWISNNIDKDLNSEAMRLVRNMPKWFPELRNGELASSVQKVAINFFLK